jgi:hypothetical protein
VDRLERFALKAVGCERAHQSNLGDPNYYCSARHKDKKYGADLFSVIFNLTRMNVVKKRIEINIPAVSIAFWCTELLARADEAMLEIGSCEAYDV